MFATVPIYNPYKKGNKKPWPTMGIQSQRRGTNTRDIRNKADYQKKNKQGRSQLQLAVNGGVAFDSLRHCIVCKAKKVKESLPYMTLPHRGHHPLCLNNRRTRGMTKAAFEQEKTHEDRLKALWKPLIGEPIAKKRKERLDSFYGKPNDDEDGKPAAVVAAVSPNNSQEETTVEAATDKVPAVLKSIPTLGIDVDKYYHSLMEFVSQTCQEPEFQNQFKKGLAPFPVLAAAKYLHDTVIPKNLVSRTTKSAVNTDLSNSKMDKFLNVFKNKMFLEIPEPPYEGEICPFVHSVAGTKIFLVQWELLNPAIQLQCPRGCCDGVLEHDRTAFSKNKLLFPIINIDGPPDWVIVMKYKCDSCGKMFAGNDGAILQDLPLYIRAQYPVYPRYATGRWHLSRPASDLFEELMMTYGNGELASRLFYGMINKHYIWRLEEYLSYHAHHDRTCDEYPLKDSEYIRYTLPSGAALRALYEEVSKSPLNYEGISDNDRHTREIQSVDCKIMFAQDHTMEVVKNYRSNLGAYACWDVCTETGEIASAVLVPSTKAADFAHAAEALARRPGFKPYVMYSDTWPSGKEFWALLMESLRGRLGLFHYAQRIVKTLRTNHIDHKKAVWELMLCIYDLHEEDLAKVLKALKEGKMAQDGYKYTQEEIDEMKLNGKFKQRFYKYIRKRMLPGEVVADNLRTWFNNYKVESSDPDKPGGGRLDPYNGKKLFTPATKDATNNNIYKASEIQDPLPVHLMYTTLEPSPTSTHKLPEYLSLRGESKLEGFHDPLSNFANGGMRESLCDALNLAGTARYNVNIRHKIYLRSLNTKERGNLTILLEEVPSYYNHTQLKFINELAIKTKWKKLPFDHARPLPEDNGERFFSDYLREHKVRTRKYKASTVNDRCQCPRCAKNPITIKQQKKQTTKNVPQNNYENRKSVHMRAPTIVDPSRSTTKPNLPAVQENPNVDTNLCRTLPQPYLLPPPVPPPPPPAFFNPVWYPMYQTPYQMYTPPFPQPPPYVPMYGQYSQNPNKRQRAKPQLDDCCVAFNNWCQLPRQMRGRAPHDPNCPNKLK